jgi:hypothetical protein
MAPTIEALARRTARLEGIEAVKGLVCRYAMGADRRNDPAIMRTLFAADATWEAKGFGRCTGADAIAQHLAAIAAEQISWSLHYMVAPLVELDAQGTAGRCRWSLWELAQVRTAGSPPAAHWIAGRYDSEVVETAQGWRFQRIALEPILVSPYAEGWRLADDLANSTFE